MRVAIVRTMHNFSMDVYADNIVSGLRTVRPNWEIFELAPHPIDRSSRSVFLRAKKFYERFWRFPNIVSKQTADIFHIIDHSEGHIVNWLKKTNKPVVITCHDLINFFYRDNLRGSVQLPIISNSLWLGSVQAMQNANQIIAVSGITAKHIAEILNINPGLIDVIPNGVERIFQPLDENTTESFRQKQGIAKERFYLLNVGGNPPRKNISTILQAIKILKDKGLPIHFLKASADFSKEQKQFIQTHALESYVTYLGQPDKSTLVKIYNAADVLLAPSLHEGFGITILEAMACGTPVITSNVSAMPEVAGDAGVLIEPTNPQAIADAVEKLYKDNAYYQNLIIKGQQRAKVFTWEETSEKIAQLYEKLV